MGSFNKENVREYKPSHILELIPLGIHLCIQFVNTNHLQSVKVNILQNGGVHTCTASLQLIK